MRQLHSDTTAFARFFFYNTKIAALWLVVRLYVGWEWMSAGWDKIHDPLWWGSNAGAPLTGFIQGALQKTTGIHPDVPMWYAKFLFENVLTHVVFWSELVSIGELLVGVALILGFLVGVSAFFGALMNFNYLLAGTVSVNPTFFLLGILLILAWRISGYIGLDYYVLPKFSYIFGRRK